MERGKQEERENSIFTETLNMIIITNIASYKVRYVTDPWVNQ